MSATQLNATESDRIAIDVPEGLTAAESKLVYVFLAASGGATIDELTDALDISKISLFPVLRTLIERDAVTRDGSAYVPRAS
ncbi:MAG: MarR family transcriptional regulator [Haloplanus sp.]